MKKIVILLTALVITAFAASETKFPANWKEFTVVNTTLADIGGALPDCSADVSAFPAIYQETIATYCAVKPGGPGAVEIIVSDVVAYTKRDGKTPNGVVEILHLKDLKLLFVTEWIAGKPMYGIFTEDGTDAANAVGTGLNPQDCRTCHTGYEAFCINGQCGKKTK
ncbi:MAG: hypothetical protein GQ570_02135 [Helicobacteraceae bacterium]|nr:hypothetical protein [Helicobacteraceae bacterium]